MDDKLLNFGKELVPVELPEIPDEKVFVRSLTTGERLVLEEVKQATRGLIGDHEFVYLGTFRADGSRRFTATTIRELDGRIAARLALAVLKVSGLTREAQEEAAKKSEASPS